MKWTPFTLLIFFMLLSACNQQYEGPYEPDIKAEGWAEMRLKGKVKAFTNRVYAIGDSLPFPVVIPDSIVPNSVHIMRFDEKGRWTTSERWRNGEFWSRKELRYGQEGKLEGISYFDEKGAETIIQYKYNSIGKPQEWKRLSPTGQLSFRTKYTYDRKGRLIEKQEISYDADGREIRDSDALRYQFIHFESGSQLVRKFRDGFHFQSSLEYEGLVHNTQFFDSTGALESYECCQYDANGKSIGIIHRDFLENQTRRFQMKRDSQGNLLSKLVLRDDSLSSYEDCVLDSMGEVVRRREWSCSFYGGKMIPADTTRSPKRVISNLREYDRNGNWTRQEEREVGKAAWLHLRTIEYYK